MSSSGTHAFKVLPPATRYPAGRRRLLVGAHLAWGIAADLLVAWLGSSGR